MINIFIAGDVVNSNSNDVIFSKALEKLIKEADYSVCNFEAPVSGFGSAQLKSGPHISQSSDTIGILKKQGFDLILLANNHMMDYGKQGLIGTIETARQKGLEVIGAGANPKDAYRPIIQEIKSIKIGFINACEAQFGAIDYSDNGEDAGYAWINHPKIDRTILELKKKCDFILVFPHAGLENYDIPQKEWRERYKHLCDLGADVVIGSHPHVPQGYEEYNDSLIFYSLGNFYFDYGSYGKLSNNTYSVLLELGKDKKIKFRPIFSMMKNNKTEICNQEEQIDLAFLSNLLSKEKYMGLHKDMTLDSYKIIKKYLAMSNYPFPTDGTILGTFKEVALTLFGKRRGLDKSILKLHMLRNETYRNALQHALELENTNKI